MMDQARFVALVQTWGADPVRWPAAERGAALALLETSEAARAVVEREKRLDLLLDAVPTPAAASADLARRLAGLAREPRSLWAELAALFGGWRLAGATLAACVVVGVTLGATLPLAPDAADPAEGSLLSYAILTESYLEH